MVGPTEPLQVDDHHRRRVVDLDLLDGLHVLEALITVPSVIHAQFLGPVELPYAVVD